MSFLVGLVEAFKDSEDRRFKQKLLGDERDYEQKIRSEDRAYQDRVRGEDRAFDRETRMRDIAARRAEALIASGAKRTTERRGRLEERNPADLVWFADRLGDAEGSAEFLAQLNQHPELATQFKGMVLEAEQKREDGRMVSGSELLDTFKIYGLQGAVEENPFDLSELETLDLTDDSVFMDAAERASQTGSSAVASFDVNPSLYARPNPTMANLQDDVYQRGLLELITADLVAAEANGPAPDLRALKEGLEAGKDWAKAQAAQEYGPRVRDAMGASESPFMNDVARNPLVSNPATAGATQAPQATLGDFGSEQELQEYLAENGVTPGTYTATIAGQLSNILVR